MLRTFGLVLALLLVAPCASQAASPGKPSRQAASAVSRCGRHTIDVLGGSVRLDGTTLESSGGEVQIVIAPKWRRDCRAVAWVEQKGTARRLMVVPSIVPSIEGGAQSLHWTLPPTGGSERIFWVSRSRISVGIALLRPRATASWS